VCGQFLRSSSGTIKELLEEDKMTTEVIFILKGFQKHIFKIQEFLLFIKWEEKN
jgi:hypothetical protein